MPYFPLVRTAVFRAGPHVEVQLTRSKDWNLYQLNIFCISKLAIVWLFRDDSFLSSVYLYSRYFNKVTNIKKGASQTDYN